jgi:hypothetical protein
MQVSECDTATNGVWCVRCIGCTICDHVGRKEQSDAELESSIFDVEVNGLYNRRSPQAARLDKGRIKAFLQWPQCGQE